MKLEVLQAQLVRHEGLRLKPYQDSVGKWTIGVGRNLDDIGISSDEAMLLLQNDITRSLDDLDRDLPWWREMDEARQLVIADMCFNMGIGTLLTFRNTLASMQRGDYEAAADGMGASLWAKQVGPRAARLAQMMRNGDLA